MHNSLIIQFVLWQIMLNVLTVFPHIGGYRLQDLSISQVISHVTPYKFNSSHWLKLQHSDWRANLVKDFFLINKFSTNKSTLIFKGSHDF